MPNLTLCGRQEEPLCRYRALRKVRLELSWTFPERGESAGVAAADADDVDYLDGSALAYSGESLLDVVDYHGALRRMTTKWRRSVGAHPDGKVKNKEMPPCWDFWHAQGCHRGAKCSFFHSA